LSSVRRWLGGRRRAELPGAPVAVDRKSAAAAERDARVEVMLAEWQEIRESLRACERQRLAQLALFLLVSLVLGFGYLPIATAAEARWGTARWALPAFGALLTGVFLSLESGSLAYRREWARRGRQIETAVQVLVPGIGHMSSLALLSQFDPDSRARVRLATAAIGALYALLLVAWATALIVMALAPSR